MGFKAKEFILSGSSATVNVPLHDGFDGNFIVHLKEGAAETVTISAVSSIFTDVAGVETAVAITATTTLTAGITLAYASKVVSDVIRITLTAAPISNDTVIEIIAQH